MILDYIPLFLSGLKYTLFVCTSAVLLGIVLGGLLYFMATLNNIIFRLFYRTYILIFRGTPLLVQVYLVFYGGPLLGLTLNATQVGILGLGLYATAYFAEIYRIGFNSIPKGQIESAVDIGLSKSQILLHIQIPQIFNLIIPPMTNQIIILIKESAILSIITVPELMTAATKMATETFKVTEPYLLLALAYWLITFSVGKLGTWSEKKTTYYLIRS
ncbi:MAG TPA: amino acid ABC transporter permease [Pasteurellaceae bacterium]|nr:amino acid ABC transporter permease [Pasteurellaceae bacterium]